MCRILLDLRRVGVKNKGDRQQNSGYESLVFNPRFVEPEFRSQSPFFGLGGLRAVR